MKIRKEIWSRLPGEKRDLISFNCEISADDLERFLKKWPKQRPLMIITGTHGTKNGENWNDENDERAEELLDSSFVVDAIELVNKHFRKIRPCIFDSKGMTLDGFNELISNGKTSIILD